MTAKNPKDLITIFIPVHNRQYFIKRCQEYYRQIVEEHGVNVVFYDSSEKPYDKDVGPCKYHYYGPLKNIEKNPEVFKRYPTPYMVCAADDDLYIIESILKCLKFLINNPEYSVAHGTFLRFKQHEGVPRYEGKNPYGVQQWCLGREENFSSTNPANRIKHFFNFSRFHMLNHSVVKREPFLRAVERHLDPAWGHLNAVRYCDQIQATYLLLEGNMKWMDCIYGLRGDQRITLSTQSVTPTGKPWFTTKKDFSSYLSDIKEGDPLSTVISDQTELTKSEARQLQEEVFGRYIHGRFKVKKKKLIPKTSQPRPQLSTGLDRAIKILKKYTV